MYRANPVPERLVPPLVWIVGVLVLLIPLLLLFAFGGLLRGLQRAQNIREDSRQVARALHQENDLFDRLNARARALDEYTRN